MTNTQQRGAVEPIAENGYNLSVSSYVEAQDTREVVDIAKIDTLRAQMDAIVAEIEAV